MGGSASINAVNPNCTLVIDSCAISCSGAAPPDFKFEQNVCSPNTVQFSTNLPNIQTYQWQFGNGQTMNGPNPLVVYSNYNTYAVKLIVQNTSGCLDSVTKMIPVQVQQADIIITADTTICAGDSFVLQTKGVALSSCWQPSAGLNSSTSVSPVAKPATTTIYSFNTKVTGINLVKNGDFSNGNTGFSSDYSFSSSGIPPAVYTVGTNPGAWHPAMPLCKDHTSGTGNMMMVNGSEIQNTKVWSQTISISPNTNYVFSTWLQTITTINPAQLQFFINGVAIGNIFTANEKSCVWEEFYSNWNSGNNTTATISIVNMNKAFSGNDFAIDDIFFGEKTLKTESIKVTVASAPDLNFGNDVALCNGSSIQLTSNTDANNSIMWSPSTFLSNASIANPIATPSKSITYIASAKNNFGCTKSDTITIKVVEKPTVILPNDTTVCRGSPVLIVPKSTNTATYIWRPATALSDSTSATTLATPNATTLYKLIASNKACSATDSMLLSVEQLPALTVSKDTTICSTAKAQLNASGAISYNWTPTTGLSLSNIPNPVASPASTTIYTVSATGGNGCKKSDSIQVVVIPKPVFAIQPSIQTICFNDSTTLRATGGDVYLWTPANSVSSPASGITKVSPTVATTYKVHIKNSVCKWEDSAFATVNVAPLPAISISKSNDIDCSSTNAQLIVTGGNSFEWYPSSSLSSGSIYNPVASPTQTTTYAVKAKSLDGCIAKDSITVNVINNNGTKVLYVPSAFTPNGDGKNDCFGVKNFGSTANFSLSIYNRWGEKVFSTNNPANCWDGTFNGLKQGQGTFIYYIKAKTFCGDLFKKGVITLIR